MRKTVLSLAVALSFAGAVAQTPRHLDPTVVSIGKELPRGEVVSHDSKADAVRRTTGASKYLQPLTGWTRSETAEAVTYKTRYTIPFAWIDRRQFLYVGRASGSFDVVVNGRHTAYSQTGGTPGEFDITEASREGANDLEITIYKDPVALKLENGRTPVAPRLEGEVWVLSQPRIRVRDVAVSTRMEGGSGLLELGVILKSHQLNPHDYTVYWELLNPAGEILAEGKKDARLDMRREDTVRFFANIPRVVPWSHEQPQLYTLFIKTQNEGRFREYLSFRVGFRSYDLREAGNGEGPGPGPGLGGAGGSTLYLNGVPLSLSMREFSPAGDMAAMRGQIESLRSVGVMGLMLQGAPPSREFFSLCDSLGMYVACRADIDTHLSGESRQLGGNPSNDPAWEGAYRDRVLAMYHTSKNHPSVAMFSLARHSSNGLNLYESYLALKELEPHRPVLYTDGGGEWNTDALDMAAGGATAGAGTGTPPTPTQTSTLTQTPTPSPGWLTLEAVDLAAGRFRIGNSRRITPLTGEAVYKIIMGRRNVVSTGSVPIETLPGETTQFTVPITGVKAGKPFTVAIEIAVERTSGDYLPAGDPNLKIFRRLDQPLAPAARTVIASGEFKSGD
jgi:beta-galactosidase